MAETDDEHEIVTARRDGEEAPPRGYISILEIDWDVEEGRKWGKEFAAREEARAKSSSHLLGKRLKNKKLLDAFRRKADPIAYCVFCNTVRLHDEETNEEWVNRDDCKACRAKGVRPRDVQVRFCRYCSASYTREEALKGGKHHHAWYNGNKCAKCVDAPQKIECALKGLLLEHLKLR